MYKIFVVEDDPSIAQGIQHLLQSWQYDVHIATNFNQILTDYLHISPHLIIMDITLPLFNGYYWTQEIRKHSSVPILFLSSHNQPSDIIMSLNIGADDYVTKPFDANIFIAKVQSILRRSYELANETEWLEFHGVILNLKTTRLHYQQHILDLTKNEFLILRTLFEHPEQYVTREQLMQQLWHSDIFIDDNTLSVNIARLRKKLDSLHLHTFIHTKKGYGYGLVHPDASNKLV